MINAFLIPPQLCQLGIDMEVRNAYENMVHLKFEPRATSSMLTVLASTNLESKQNGQFGYKLQVPPCLQLLATGKARL